VQPRTERSPVCAGDKLENRALPAQRMTDDRVNILLVDDQPANLIALEAMLQSLGQNLIKADSGREALKWLLTQVQGTGSGPDSNPRLPKSTHDMPMASLT